jgi:hypothetical protein
LSDAGLGEVDSTPSGRVVRSQGSAASCPHGVGVNRVSGRSRNRRVNQGQSHNSLVPGGLYRAPQQALCGDIPGADLVRFRFRPRGGGLDKMR